MEYVHVIVPLKLDWEPLYRVPEGMAYDIGDRVEVMVSGRKYVGVIHDTTSATDIPESRVLPLMKNLSKISDAQLPAVLSSEMELWQFMANYYLCTIGEVLKAAYPASRMKAETSKIRRKSLPSTQQMKLIRRKDDIDLCRKIYDIFSRKRPALLTATQDTSRRIASLLAERSVQDGRGVLILSPEAETSTEGNLQYNSASTAAERRDLARKLRGGEPCIVHGTRMAVFLPFVNLGLVIILDEHSTGYKQNEPTPRYNGRDTAVKLASIHNADVLLCSNVPSLESLANCDIGKYGIVTQESEKKEFNSEDRLIDTTAEKRKNGMTGSLSRKLTARMTEAFGQKQKVALLLPWKNTDEIEIEARAIFPMARTRLSVMSLKEGIHRKMDKYAVVALLCADFLLKGQDFRTDEKALRQLTELVNATGDSLMIQASDTAHPVIGAAMADDTIGALRSMMPLRKEFGLPPYSRVIDIVFRDNNEVRRFKMINELATCLKTGFTTRDYIRITLPKDKQLQYNKLAVLQRVAEFEKAREYRGHIHFDVDPA